MILSVHSKAMTKLFLLSLQIRIFMLQFLIMHRRSVKTRVARRHYWLHPLLAQCLSKGPFANVYGQMRQYPEKFSYTRMSVETFDFLRRRVCPFIEKQETNWRRPISAEERLLVSIWFLVTGESFASLHFQFMMAKYTIAKIVHETCQVLWNVLRTEFMPEPSVEVWKEISRGFLQNCNFPNCIGALDGKHTRIQMLPKSGSNYYNYKKYFSIVLMAIADSNYNFVAMDVGAYGGEADSRVFRNSAMGRRIANGTFNIPSPRPVATGGEPLPFVLVADEAFSLSTNIMKPYLRRGLDAPKKVFNYRLTRAWHVVECIFGILANMCAV